MFKKNFTKDINSDVHRLVDSIEGIVIELSNQVVEENDCGEPAICIDTIKYEKTLARLMVSLAHLEYVAASRKMT